MAGKAAPARAGRAPRPPRAPLPREVRIIGGLWKRSRLPVADKPGLRPTPDRVRETLFNWLDHDLAGWRCVDAFAGTGALGFEAASRGAAQVLMVEQDPELVAQLRTVHKRLDAQAVRIERGNGLSVLARLAPGSVDLVFLDPPFDAAILDKALAATAALLAPGGLAYLEAPAAWEEPALAPLGFVRLRHLRAGAVHAHLLQRTA